MEALRSLCVILAILPLHLQATCKVGEPDRLNVLCYCANKEDCNGAIDGCPGGCRNGMPRPVGNETYFDWRGPLCRIGNVAYKKHANQSGRLRSSWPAEQAVDGLLPLSTRRSAYTCSRSYSYGVIYAWWIVDLEGIFAVHNITIYNRLASGDTDTTAYFDVRIGNKSDYQSNELCTHYVGPAEAGGNVTLTCDYHQIGRYVSIHRTGGSSKDVISLCEVVVMGYETTNCTGCKVECNDRTGCRECAHSYPPHCTIPCEAGSYGANCACSCADHHCAGGYKTCDRATGECPDGCEDWYLGPQCTLFVGQLNLTDETDLGVAALGSAEIKFTWRVVSISSNLAPYYGYLMEYKTDGDPAFFNEFTAHPGTGNVLQNVTVSGLLSNTWYKFRLSAFRKLASLYELSPWQTFDVVAKTACESPDVATDVKITQNTGGNRASVIVEWKEASSGCKSIISTQVLFRPVGTNEWVTQDIPEHRQTNTAVITNIKEDHDLEIKIRVVNNEHLSSDTQSYIAQLAGKGGRHLHQWRTSTIAIAVLLVISNMVSWSVLCYCQRCRCHQQDVPTAEKPSGSPAGYGDHLYQTRGP